MSQETSASKADRSCVSPSFNPTSRPTSPRSSGSPRASMSRSRSWSPAASSGTSGGLRRVGLDYLRHARLARFASWSAFDASRRAAGERLVLLTTRAERAYHEVSYRADDVLHGRARERRRAAAGPCRRRAAVRVPMAPGRRSLNVVTALAIVLSEALRQTGGWPSDPGRAVMSPYHGSEPTQHGAAAARRAWFEACAIGSARRSSSSRTSSAGPTTIGSHPDGSRAPHGRAKAAAGA